MNEININIKLFKEKKVLITPLNWGLGHATRCIPIIRLLLDHQVEVVIASDGAALSLLQSEFPNLSTIDLPAYNIKYPFKSMELNMVLQSYRFAKAIIKEKTAIQQIVADYRIDVIISDNRFGCQSANCHNIFLTHQINILGSYPLSQWLVRKINGQFIKKFDELWIPDFETKLSLAGALSAPSSFANTRYINPLSRFQKKETPVKFDVAIVLSGPEPARTTLEKRLLKICYNTNHKTLMVRGTNTPISSKKIENNNLTIIDLLQSEALNDAILSAKMIICRAGYSSIMDLYQLDKIAIIIPTPGQTEQEYLADYHQQKNKFKVWRESNTNEELADLIASLISPFS